MAADIWRLEMSNISNLYDFIENEFNQNQNLLNQISILLTNLVSKLAFAAAQSNEGYCSRFTIPESQVSDLYKILKLKKDDVSVAFRKDWGHPVHAKMHNDSYYHVLLLLIYWGIKKDSHYMMHNALVLILIKIWNGRKQKYLKFCNVTTMNYVIENMLNKKHLAADPVNNSPYALIVLHYVPKLLNKYKPRILQDSKDLKTLFEQGWRRIDQLFLQKEKKNPLSGKVKPASGLMLLYMKAQEEGLTLSSPRAITGNEEESYSEGEDENSITQITENIFTETADYEEEFLKELRKDTKVSKNVIINLLNTLHSANNKVQVQNLCRMIIYRTGARSKEDILSSSFKESVEKKIISSKIQEDVISIKDRCDVFIKIVYKRKNEYRDLSPYKKHQRRKVLIRGLVYNIQQRTKSLEKKDWIDKYFKSKR